MFDPDDITDTMPHHTTRAQAAQEASTAPPKAVNYPNTRLTTWEDQTAPDDTTLPASPSISAIDAAIRRRGPAPPSTLAGSTTAGSETPRVNGYAFVDEEPTPSELQVFSKDAHDDSLLAQMISSSAAEAGGGSAVRNPFTIAESSKREALLHRMVEKTNVGKRAAAAMTRATPTPTPTTPGHVQMQMRISGGQHGRLAELQGAHASGRTPTPKFLSSPRVVTVGGATPGRAARTSMAGLTPAARKLYDKVGRTPGGPGGIRRTGVVGGGGLFDFDSGKGKAGWTPTTPVAIKRAG